MKFAKDNGIYSTMNDKQVSNPIYERLFPVTHAKNVKLNAALNTILNDYRYTPRIKTVESEEKVNN